MSANGRHNGDEIVVAMLASGHTYAQAGKEAGLSEKTVQRRMASPAFRRRVEETRAGLVSQAVGRAADGLVEAVDTLRELMRLASSDNVRVAAASTLLQFAAQRRDHPLVEAVRGAQTVPINDFAAMLRNILDITLDKISPEQHLAVLDEIEALARV
jgi:hypothetical protein